MCRHIKNFFDEAQRLSQPKIDRINAYWDEKTLFVHRRALILGVALGIVLGISLTMTLLFAISTIR